MQGTDAQVFLVVSCWVLLTEDLYWNQVYQSCAEVTSVCLLQRTQGSILYCCETLESITGRCRSHQWDDLSTDWQATKQSTWG